jgi:hypothetical protein
MDGSDSEVGGGKAVPLTEGERNTLDLYHPGRSDKPDFRTDQLWREALVSINERMVSAGFPTRSPQSLQKYYRTTQVKTVNKRTPWSGTEDRALVESLMLLEFSYFPSLDEPDAIRVRSLSLCNAQIKHAIRSCSSREKLSISAAGAAYHIIIMIVVLPLLWIITMIFADCTVSALFANYYDYLQKDADHSMIFVFK